jgi:hypothetical protein
LQQHDDDDDESFIFYLLSMLKQDTSSETLVGLRAALKKAIDRLNVSDFLSFCRDLRLTMSVPEFKLAMPEWPLNAVPSEGLIINLSPVDGGRHHLYAPALSSCGHTMSVAYIMDCILASTPMKCPCCQSPLVPEQCFKVRALEEAWGQLGLVNLVVLTSSGKLVVDPELVYTGSRRKPTMQELVQQNPALLIDVDQAASIRRWYEYLSDEYLYYKDSPDGPTNREWFQSQLELEAQR